MSERKEFSEDEWAQMKYMVNAIWGVDLDAITYCWTDSVIATIQVLVFDEGYGARCKSIRERWTQLYEGPKFESEIIHLDRWLIPWKVKGGFSAKLNFLLYRDCR